MLLKPPSEGLFQRSLGNLDLIGNGRFENVNRQIQKLKWNTLEPCPLLILEMCEEIFLANLI